MNEQINIAKVRPGDIFQINESHGRKGWIVTESKKWGIQGYIHQIINDNEAEEIHIRLKWNEIVYVGQAVLIPEY